MKTMGNEEQKNEASDFEQPNNIPISVADQIGDFTPCPDDHSRYYLPQYPLYGRYVVENGMYVRDNDADSQLLLEQNEMVVPRKRRMSDLEQNEESNLVKKYRVDQESVTQLSVAELATKRKRQCEEIDRITRKMAQDIMKHTHLKYLPQSEYMYFLTKVMTDGEVSEKLKADFLSKRMCCPLDILHNFLTEAGYKQDDVDIDDETVDRNQETMTSYLLAYMVVKSQMDQTMLDEFTILRQHKYITAELEEKSESKSAQCLTSSEMNLNILSISVDFLQSEFVKNDQEYFTLLIEELQNIFAVTYPGSAFFSRTKCQGKDFTAIRGVVTSTISEIQQNDRIRDAVQTYYAIMTPESKSKLQEIDDIEEIIKMQKALLSSLQSDETLFVGDDDAHLLVTKALTFAWVISCRLLNLAPKNPAIEDFAEQDLQLKNAMQQYARFVEKNWGELRVILKKNQEKLMWLLSFVNISKKFMSVTVWTRIWSDFEMPMEWAFKDKSWQIVYAKNVCALMKDCNADDNVWEKVLSAEFGKMKI